MDIHQFWRMLAPLAVLLIVFVVMLARAGRRRGVLQKKFPKAFQGATPFAALCATETDLAGQPRQLQQAAKGFVLIGGQRVTFVGSRFSADESVDFDRAQGWRLSFIPANVLAIGLPDMIRVATANDVRFLMGLGAFDQPSKAATKKLYADLQRRIDRMTGADLPATSNPPLLIVGFALLLIAIGLMIYALLSSGKLLGPQVLAHGPQGTVLAATDDALLRFSADGGTLTATPWSQLGLKNGVSGLRALPDGSILAGDFANGIISRCPVGGGPCAPLRAFTNGSFRFRGAFSFDVIGDRLFASDTGRHRMIEFSLNGGQVDEYRGDPRRLCFPNAIRILDDDRLLVADTNNFRILEWPSTKTWPEPAPTEHSTVERVPQQYGCSANDREGHGNAELDRARDYRIVGRAQPFSGLGHNSVWVAQFDRGADGRWWVVFNGENVRRGDVGILDAQWSPQKVLTLPERADPWDVLAFGDGALIADPVAAKIYRFNGSGLQVPDFGRDALDHYLAPARDRKKTTDLLRIAAPASIALIVLPLLPIGLHQRKKRVRQILALARPRS